MLGDWARISASKLPGNPGWDKLGPTGGPIDSTMQTHMSDATNPDRKRWTGFAVAALRSGRYDMRTYPGDTVPGPTVTHPDSPFWKTTAQTQADHTAFTNEANGYSWEYHSGSFNPIKAVTSAVKAVEKIPVIGDVVKVTGDIYGAPFKVAANIASGERLDHVAVDALKDQIKTIKDEAPYAQMVVSLVPGIGTGVAAAIGAGAALVEGRSITESLKAGIRGALPGGALAQAAFDTAVKVAGGENVAQAALESSRNLLPPGPAQSAFDIGVAIATGQKIQNALANGLAGIAPGQLQDVIAAGQHALATTPVLSDALKSVTGNAAKEGFNYAAGLLSHSGVNETELTAVRNTLPADIKQGFDAALKSQVPHTAWLANVVNPPPPPPKTASIKMAAPPLKTAPVKMSAPPSAPTKAIAVMTPSAYAPYPKMGTAGTLSGPVDADAVWGPVITDMDGGMQWAGRSAVHGSKGRPRAVQGPDGVDYLFEINNGALTARRRVA